jgi:nitrate reductase cytochrome c-type subunit
MNRILIVVILIMGGIITIVSCTENKVSKTSTNTDAEKIEATEALMDINYKDAGKQLAIQTKSSLANYLISSISEKGSEGAVEFCNIKAIPITDSMSVVLGAKIKRVSDLPRNPANKANEAELAYIKKWKESNGSGEQKQPIVSEINGKMVGYYPIVTNQMCLQCHGKAYKDINDATLNKINKLYPNDQATGYLENELRGIFVVEMNKN